ncbi:hypothetical protein [Actinoplanes sp. NPDC049265]|uniref:hypothetical protein n=1 Tax=Actinoplanes sp. NPDC049265 TaxID=3363902 RepID=UPI003714A55A
MLNARRPTLLGDARPVRLPDALGLGAVYRITQGPGLDAARSPNGIIGSADIAAKPTLLVGFTTPRSAILDPSEWLAARVLVHEAFHIHQSGWKPYPTPQPKPMEYPRDAENAALALLEDAVLSVPPSRPLPTAVSTLRTYLAIRAARRLRLPEADRYDRFYQYFEGTARFVEDRYVRMSGHQIADRTEDLTDGFVLLDWLARRRGYSVGASCGELLDSVVGPKWRTRIPEGEAQADIAASILGVPDAAYRERLIAEAKATFDYPKLLAMVQRADLPSVEGPPTGR